MSNRNAWYSYALKEIRESGKRLSIVDKAFLIEVEYCILDNREIDKKLEKHLMGLYERTTDV